MKAVVEKLKQHAENLNEEQSAYVLSIAFVSLSVFSAKFNKEYATGFFDNIDIIFMLWLSFIYFATVTANMGIIHRENICFRTSFFRKHLQYIFSKDIN